MTLGIRDLIVTEIDGTDDGMMCVCGSNCTFWTKDCPHACTSATRVEDWHVTANDLFRLREQMRAA